MIVVNISSLEEIPPLKPWQLAVTAGIAASGAAAISHTLDTAKTRSQATIIPRVISSRLENHPNILRLRIIRINQSILKSEYRNIGACLHGKADKSLCTAEVLACLNI